MFKKLATSALILGMTASVLPYNVLSTEAYAATKEVPKSKNVILMIGDGMGFAQLTGARLYAQKYLGQQRLALDSYFVGQASTYADPGVADGSYQSGIVTDSASAGTAFATGNKTYNAAISVSNADISRPFASFIEAAELQGFSTGLVSTARITHATPAVFGSHVRQRDNENAIASQYLESGIDVLLGGGKGNFTSKEEKGKRTDKSIIADFQAKGYQVVGNKSELAATPAEGKLLGLFGSSHVDYVIDRGTETPNLTEMSMKAIDVLSKNEKGFAMMIEGGRIDHAGHANDVHAMIEETLEFDRAFAKVIEWAIKDGNTTVLVSADHETGGFSVGANTIYEVNLDNFKALKKSSETIGKELATAKSTADVKTIMAKYTNIQFREDELQQIFDGDGSSYKREGGLNKVIAKHAMVGWTGHGHTGVDVGVYGYGPAISAVTGTIDNTDLAKVAAATIGVDLAAATKKLQDKYFYPTFLINRDKQVKFPARTMYQEFGLKDIKWDGATQTATFSKNGMSIAATVGAKSIKIDGVDVALTSAVEVDNGMMYLPLEAFEKVVGKKLSWDTLSERVVME